MLDESGARIILLVAPAGYGKTTLANEWLSRDDRCAAWYRADPASADVAALAVGLTRTVAEILPGAGERIRDRLRATDRPEDDAQVLAEMLIDDLSDWPTDAWLAIDDYHFAMESSAAEQFISTLTTQSAIRFLLTSRRRPPWASARSRLYGEFAELGRSDLAMSIEEATLVLDGKQGASDLVSRAGGWPAVIGLAALTDLRSAPADQMPSALHEFLAEELFHDVDEVTREGLLQLSIATTVTKRLASFLLGARAAGVLETSVQRGLLIQSGSKYQFHPLLQVFLQRKLREQDKDSVDSIVSSVGRYLIVEGFWDDAFTLLSTSGVPALLPELLEASLDSLLREGRTATLKRWIDASEEAQIESPIIDLAEAELSFREGIHSKTEVLALAAARKMPTASPLAARAYSLAGRSAYFEGRAADALELHETALTLSRTPETSRSALWGQFLTYLELENDAEALAVFTQLEDVAPETTEDLLRLATGRFQLAMREGTSGLKEVLAGVPLLSRSRDPLARSAFLNVCAGGLVLSARYEEALRITELQVAEAQEYRLDFALPHAYLRKAGAKLGRRAFRESHRHLDQAERLAPETRDPRLAASVRATRALAYLCCGQLDEAMTAASYGPSVESSRAARAEMSATRSLISACAGEGKAAAREAQRATTVSRALEVTMLSTFALAIAACGSDHKTASRRVEAAIAQAVRADALDYFVSACRGFPSLVDYVTPESWNVLSPLLAQVTDPLITSRAGRTRATTRDPASQLSPRETEVFELLSEGLTNKEIAHTLVVSESTVKVHVRHILEKLGVKTRTAAAALNPDRRHPD
jgi:ATP/maltotriose-dependent transcriptional regulator MalT